MVYIYNNRYMRNRISHSFQHLLQFPRWRRVSVARTHACTHARTHAHTIITSFILYTIWYIPFPRNRRFVDTTLVKPFFFCLEQPNGVLTRDFVVVVTFDAIHSRATITNPHRSWESCNTYIIYNMRYFVSRFGRRSAVTNHNNIYLRNS